MKSLTLVVLLASTVSGAFGELLIPHAYEFKCDALEVESERIDCLSLDLLKLEEIRHSIKVLESDKYMGHMADASITVAGEDPPPAPKEDPNKWYFTDREWWFFIGKVYAYSCCFSICVFCTINICI